MDSSSSLDPLDFEGYCQRRKGMDSDSRTLLDHLKNTKNHLKNGLSTLFQSGSDPDEPAATERNEPNGQEPPSVDSEEENEK